MKASRRILLAAASAALLAPATAVAAPPPPVPITPSDNAEIPQAVGAITFTVQGRRHEGPGAPRIQVDASGESTIDRTGRIRYEGGVPEYKLKQVGTSTSYEVTLSARTMRRYRGSTVGWLAFRHLPKRRCTTLKSGKPDCFQEAKDFRQFDYVTTDGYGHLEPNDTPQTARATKNNYLAYLETATDIDWVSLPASATAYDLTFELDVKDFWVFHAPSAKTTDMRATVFAATDPATPIATVTARRGDLPQKVTVPAAAGVGYLVRFEHASPDGEADILYEADFNVPGNDG